MRGKGKAAKEYIESQFFDKNISASIFSISQKTGIPGSLIENYIRSKKLK